MTLWMLGSMRFFLAMLVLPVHCLCFLVGDVSAIFWIPIIRWIPHLIFEMHWIVYSYVTFPLSTNHMTFSSKQFL